MEKFTNWRDKGTGIAPFFPVTPPLSQEKGFRSFLSNVITTLKLIVALPFLPFVYLLQFLNLSKPICTLVLKIICGWNIQTNVQGVKRRDQGPEHMPGVGRYFFVNYSSPLDCIALWLIAKGPVTFCIPRMKGKKVTMYRLSLIEALKFALKGSIFENETSFQIIDKVDEAKDYVTYIFPEGTTSNGKSVLPFALTQEFMDEFLGIEEGFSSSAQKPINLNLHKRKVVQTIQLKINATLTTPLPISAWNYLNRMSSQGVTFKCKINEPCTTKVDEVRTALCGGDKYSLVGKDLNVDSKTKFIKEFGNRRR
ncbi:LAFE_0F04786g1_1 [Lachancea fermentati]|uniref:LAFE_0F04786g1_1 n=1 Tax=Lachancea fermentati TaxID=4955 RepID=A0A1G4MEL2_LACFM|nr:LAFE_0F04786g1_1 [Lachancea fermentati]